MRQCHTFRLLSSLQAQGGTDTRVACESAIPFCCTAACRLRVRVVNSVVVLDTAEHEANSSCWLPACVPTCSMLGCCSGPGESENGEGTSAAKSRTFSSERATAPAAGAGAEVRLGGAKVSSVAAVAGGCTDAGLAAAALVLIGRDWEVLVLWLGGAVSDAVGWC
jgi:hypothetical protein